MVNIHLPLLAISLVAMFGGIQAYAVSGDACPLCETTDLYDKIRDSRESDIPVRVWIERNLYEYGSEIQVRGAVANIKEMPVTIKITGPQNNVVEIQQIEVSEDRTFQTTFNAKGGLWNMNGVYTIRAQYGSYETNDKTSFELVGSRGIQAQCLGNQIVVTGADEQYCINYKIIGATIDKATVSQVTKSITLNVNAEDDGSVSLTIPRYILDSKSSAGDSPFLVMIDEQPSSEYYEQHSDDEKRTIDISIPQYAEQIEIIGTYAVPEFGTLAAIILAVAVTSAIIMTARVRLGNTYR